MSAIIDAARDLAARVGPVLPLNGKIPLWKDWPQKATRTPNGEPEWKRATGVGLLTGERAGFFVLDVDPAHGGSDTLDVFEHELGELPTTWTQITGSGGRHFFFRWPGFPVRGSAGKLGAGLDVRGEGGQVVAPPSAHPSGTVYRWVEGRAPGECAIVDAPEWLLEMLKPPAPALIPQLPAADRSFERARAYLRAMPEAISGSGGHDALFAAAQAMVRGFRLSAGEGLSLLLSEYNPRCSPPWSEKEVQHKVDDASGRSSLAYGYLLDAERRPEGPQRSTPEPTQKEPTECGEATPLERLSTVGILGDELDALDIPPPVWIVKDFVQACTLLLVYGPPNSGKTFLLIDLIARALADGKRVVFFEAEGSAADLRMRLRRAYAAHGVTREQQRNLLAFHNPSIDLSRPEDVDTIIKVVLNHRAEMVALDSLAALAGDADENDSATMKAVSGELHRIKVKTGAAVVTLHHMTKQGSAPGEKPSLRTLRGHSALAGRIDSAIAVVQDEEATTEHELVFEIFDTKQRAIGKHKPRRCTVAMPSSGEAAFCVIEDVDVAGEKQQAHSEKVDYMARQMLDELPPVDSAPGMTTGELRKAVGGNTAIQTLALAQLNQTKRVVRIHGKLFKPSRPDERGTDGE